MAEEAIRTMQRQFKSALDGQTTQNTELQAELAQSRQQAANELAVLQQEVRALQRGSQTTGVGVDARLLGKPCDSSGAQDAWRDWSAVSRTTLAQRCHDCRS